MTNSMIQFGASSVAGAVGGNRTHRYITDGTQNMTQLNRNDMIATTIGTAVPLLAIKAFPERKITSSLIAMGATAFSVAYGLTSALLNHDNNTADAHLPNKENDIMDAKETVKNIFDNTKGSIGIGIEKSIFTDHERRKYGYRTNSKDILNPLMANEYIVDTNIENPRFRRDLTRDKETFDILIEKKLYPFLGTSAEQIKQSESIAKTQKANLETIHTCKQKAEDFGNSGRWSPHTSGFLGIENEKNLYSDKLKEFNIIIKDLNTIITAKDDPQSPLQEPTKRLASVIKHYIETDVKKRVDYEYQSRLIDEIKRGIRHNSSNKFQHEYSIPYKKMMDDIKALNFDQLNDFISFIHEQEEWKKDNIKSISYGRDYISGKHGTYLHSQDGTKTEITQAEYDNFDLDNYTKICDKFGKDAMPYHQVYGEYNVLKRLKNVFTEALREKVLDNYDTPFRFDYDRYTHPENAYKELDEAVEAKHKQPSWFEKMRKQFNATRDTYFTSQEQTIDEEQKPSPSQILTITDTEVKAFGSKDKAIEIRNQLMELKASDTQEDFYKRKNKIFKKLSAQYHPDKPNGSDNAQAFINKINKYVDFYLAKEFWKLPDDKRGY